MTSKKKQFEVGVNITLQLGVTVAAETLEEALEIGRAFTVTDLISLKGHVENNSDIELCSAYKC